MESIAVLALDIHKRFSQVAGLSSEGEVLLQERVGHEDREVLEALLEAFPEETPVVMEATFNWPWIADLAEGAGLSPHLAQPREARRLGKRMPKSDKKDAVWLGHLWLAPTVFPEAYRAPREVRRMRRLFRARLLLVRIRTAVKNSIHGHLHQLGVCMDGQVSDLFSPKGRRLLGELSLDAEVRWWLEQRLLVVEDLSRRIEVLETRIRAGLREDSRAQILMSIPGVGELTAYSILAEMGDIDRFPNGRALAAYAGVLPLPNESGGKDLGKHTGKECNQHLRWAVLEAVTGAIRSSARMKSLHSRVKARNKKKAGKARVAVAREIMELVHLLLTRGERYQETPPPRPGSRRSRGDADAGTTRAASDPNRASQVGLSARSDRSQAGV